MLVKSKTALPWPYLQRERGVVCFVAYGCVIVCVLGLFSIKTLRELGIRKIRYANYCVVPVRDITISLPLQSCLKDMVPYLELAN